MTDKCDACGKPVEDGQQPYGILLLECSSCLGKGLYEGAYGRVLELEARLRALDADSVAWNDVLTAQLWLGSPRPKLIAPLGMSGAIFGGGVEDEG